MKSIVLIIVLGCASLVSLASGPNTNAVQHGGGTADVSWVPDHNGNPLFHVTYDNGSGAGFIVVVMDENGDQLYHGYFTDKKFDKFFQIADPESYGKLTFVIRDMADNTSQRFEVSSTDRLVENVEVKEVK
jgi:hypothetical protein